MNPLVGEVDRAPVDRAPAGRGDHRLDRPRPAPVDQLGAHAAGLSFLGDPGQPLQLGVVDGEHERAEPPVGNVEALAQRLPAGVGAVDEVGVQRARRAVVGDRDSGVALARPLPDVG
jgi:hypothetical protein